MSFAFLSPEWIEAAREIRERYSSQTAPIEVAVRVNQVVTEVPFGDGELHAHIDTSSGDVDLELGHLDQPDATITLSYETARALLVERDPAKVMQAFMSGGIQVEGDLMKVMAMQASTPQDDLALQVAEEILAITDLD
ncbi:MAG: SCP2 sterol-binding domain-containing protein [Actinobacteria bacterium]|nr:SCP2 sterol-binding domain-containing protein [Ilumatobacteraceae bacterium]MDA0298928.1 SCP2 sterol-binding domain-containing protein [Actinomycetota bacterium]MDA2960811.1 SCP2 sterol-binding domain-containing protein [Actinomycetota bacterium]MDA2994328.1 SCP2 sterol-binding domain-containing protein [Actinomycetota bacterium]